MVIPKIGETISKEQFNKLYPVGTTLSAEEFANYGQQKPEQQPVENPVLETISGATKGAMSLPFRAMELGKSLAYGAGKIMQKIPIAPIKKAGEKITQYQEQGKAPELLKKITTVPESLKPQTTAEKIGYTAEQIAEFLVPTGLAIKGAQLATKVPKIGVKLGLVGKSLGTAAEFTGKTVLQKGGDINEVKRAAIIGLLTPPAISMISGITKFITKGVPEKLYSQIFKSAEDDLRAYYKTVAKGQEVNPTLAKELLDRGLKGNSQNMAVYSIKKIDELENLVQQTVRTKQLEGITINLGNKKGYKDILNTVVNQFKSGFLSNRAKEATQLSKELSSVKGQNVSMDLGLRLRRFIDQMRNTSSFRLDPKLTPRQEEFKVATDYLRKQLSNAGLKDLMNEERIFIQATDNIIEDAVKRANKNILNLTDILVGGGGMAGGFPGTGIGAAVAIRGFQLPISLTSISQLLYKGGKAIDAVFPFLSYSIPRTLPNLIPSTKP
jgi:hypothetical protein